MTVIVTGGAGFIGSALVGQLNALGTSVVTIDKLTYAANPDNLADLARPDLHRLHQVDICDAPAVRRIFAETRPVAIYHLAAESHVDRSIDDPVPFVRTNVEGSAVLLTATRDYCAGLDATARGQFRFLQVSTDEVYGELGASGAFDENSPYRPNSPYAASKAAADHFARAFARTYDLPVLLTNCGNNYGPRQFPEKLIPLTILNAVAGKTLPVYGAGQQVRDWIHVDDHAAALRAVVAGGRPRETYLVGARGEMRNVDIVQKICALLDVLKPRTDGRPYAEQIAFVTDRPGHDDRYAIDPRKIESEIGWYAAIEVDRGLRETVEWYLDNPAFCARSEASYDRRRIGLISDDKEKRA
ncbi:MAG: dTDP-glucose 4,6-dehydratase [Rhodospirillaceae bacterium]|nr:dTDP-glucose 4,6-dehydratase [Rhodospirillaceae bacterium]